MCHAGTIRRAHTRRRHRPRRHPRANLELIERDCGGPYTIVAEREVVTGWYTQETRVSDTERRRTTGTETESEIVYRCGNPRPIQPALP